MKTCKKAMDQTKFGAAAKYIKQYINQLIFLNKSIVLNETESSFDNTNNTDSPNIGCDDSFACPGGDVRARAERNVPSGIAEEQSDRKRSRKDIEMQTLNTLKEDDLKVLFFKGILPSMKKFSDDENLQFQSGMINFIQKIKRSSIWQLYPVQYHNQTYI